VFISFLCAFHPRLLIRFEIDLPPEVVTDGGFCDPLIDKSARFFGVVMQRKRKMKQIELIASERTLEREESEKAMQRREAISQSISDARDEEAVLQAMLEEAKKKRMRFAVCLIESM
jgi:hypothetical protein